MIRKYLPLLAAFIVGTASGWLIKQGSSDPELSTGLVPDEGTAVSEMPVENRDNTTGNEDARLNALIEKIEERDAEIASMRQAMDNLQSEKDLLADEVEQLNREWVFSYGSTREAGSFVGKLIRDGYAIRQLDRDDPQRAMLAASVFMQFSSLGPILQEMQNLDDKPSEFAEFRTAALAEVVGMDRAAQQQVQSLLESYKTQALGLEVGSETRAALNQQATDSIRGVLNEEQRAFIDRLAGSTGGLLDNPLDTPSLNPRDWGRRR